LIGGTNRLGNDIVTNDMDPSPDWFFENTIDCPPIPGIKLTLFDSSNATFVVGTTSCVLIDFTTSRIQFLATTALSNRILSIACKDMREREQNSSIFGNPFDGHGAVAARIRVKVLRGSGRYLFGESEHRDYALIDGTYLGSPTSLLAYTHLFEIKPMGDLT
jgi:hypothetical protein